MKNNILFSTLILGFLFATSCGGKANSDSTSTEKVESSESVSGGNGDCIISYQSKYDELLPLDVIKKHFKGEMPDAEKEYDKNSNEKYRNHDKYIYTWKSNRTRTMEIGGNKMTLPIANEIGLQWVGDDMFMMSKNKTPLENFKGFYRNASQEEIDKAMAIADAQIRKKEGVTKEQADAATGMAKGMSAETRFENVEGVGEAASWVVKENKLVVLVGNVTFQVIANVGTDKAANIDLAKKLAIEVLNKCK
jgi:hypothetical protein